MNRPTGSGLDQFKAMQEKFKPTDLDVILGKAKAGESKYGSQFDRLQMDAGRRAAMTEEMRSSTPELLGLSERGATAVGRSYFDPERIEERERRIRSRRQAAALSPFAGWDDGFGGGGGARMAPPPLLAPPMFQGGLPMNMAYNSVMNAMSTSSPTGSNSTSGMNSSFRSEPLKISGGPIMMAGPGPIESAQMAALRR